MIHQTAIVDAGAVLGKDVSVGPFSYIEGDVKIGDGCVIGPHVTILRYTTLGARCSVHAGAVLGDDPQDIGYRGHVSYVVIGDDCVLREGVTVHRGAKEGSVTRIGNHGFMMSNSHFAHDVQVGNRVIMASGAVLAGYAEIGDNVFISGNAGVHQFCRVGRLAMLGGISVATSDVPPFCIVRTGSHNRIIGLNVIGMRRAGIGAGQRLEIKRAFRILYRSGLGVTNARIQIAEQFPSGPAHEFVTFIEGSKRGICGFGGGKEDE